MFTKLNWLGVPGWFAYSQGFVHFPPRRLPSHENTQAKTGLGKAWRGQAERTQTQGQRRAHSSAANKGWASLKKTQTTQTWARPGQESIWRWSTSPSTLSKSVPL